MSSLKIEERFTVAAPPDQVWSFLVDPSRVVACLPGAALTESSEDGTTHRGTVTVKAGPITVSYKGTAEFVEVDEADRRLRMEAKGQEKSGSGSVSMIMVSTVGEHADGAEVVVDSEVKLTGKLVSFGRGMIDAVAQEILQDFTGCLASKLEGGEAGGDSDENGTGPESTDAPDSGTGRAAKTPAGTREASGAAEPREPRPAGGLGLLFRGLWRWLRGIFGGGGR